MYVFKRQIKVHLKSNPIRYLFMKCLDISIDLNAQIVDLIYKPNNKQNR